MTILNDTAWPRYLTALTFLTVSGLNANVLLGQRELGAVVLLVAILHPLHELRRIERNTTTCFLWFGLVVALYCALCLITMFTFRFIPFVVLSLEMVTVGFVAHFLKKYFETCIQSGTNQVQSN